MSILFRNTAVTVTQKGLLKTVECPPTATVQENYAMVRETLGLA